MKRGDESSDVTVRFLGGRVYELAVVRLISPKPPPPPNFCPPPPPNFCPPPAPNVCPPPPPNACPPPAPNFCPPPTRAAADKLPVAPICRKSTPGAFVLPSQSLWPRKTGSLARPSKLISWPVCQESKLLRRPTRYSSAPFLGVPSQRCVRNEAL